MNKNEIETTTESHLPNPWNCRAAEMFHDVEGMVKDVEQFLEYGENDFADMILEGDSAGAQRQLERMSNALIARAILAERQRHGGRTTLEIIEERVEAMTGDKRMFHKALLEINRERVARGEALSDLPGEERTTE